MHAKKSLVMLLGSVLSFAAPMAMATPTASMLADTCAGCHGVDGVSGGPAIPTIAGKSAEYLNTVMEQYKTGERHATIMNRIAKGYSEAEIALMADHFAALPYKAASQSTDKGKVKAGKKLYKKNCGKCHDENGSLADDDAGILAGQWLPYLQFTMTDYKEGRSDMSKKMAKKVNGLSADQLD